MKRFMEWEKAMTDSERTGQDRGMTRRGALAGMAVLALAAKTAPATAQTTTEVPMTLDPARTALLLLHYQGDILPIFAQAGIEAQVARMTALAAHARAAGIPVIFVRIGFSPDYREISPQNQNGQMIRSFGLFTADAVPEGLRASEDTRRARAELALQTPEARASAQRRRFLLSLGAGDLLPLDGPDAP